MRRVCLFLPPEASRRAVPMLQPARRPLRRRPTSHRRSRDATILPGSSRLLQHLCEDRQLPASEVPFALTIEPAPAKSDQAQLYTHLASDRSIRKAPCEALIVLLPPCGRPPGLLLQASRPGIGTHRLRIARRAHAASANGPYGLHGIIRFDVPGHPGTGVHSGRANARHLPGPEHPTMGCIRTCRNLATAASRAKQ